MNEDNKALNNYVRYDAGLLFSSDGRDLHAVRDTLPPRMNSLTRPLANRVHSEIREKCLTFCIATKHYPAMMKQDDAIQAHVEQFLRIVNRYTTLQKKPYNFGIGEKLHPAEIHTVSAIAAAGTINVTKLALRLGVTRGAVSQMAARLEKKGLVSKTRERGNDKEVLMALTRKGQRANEGHIRFHAGMYAEFASMMARNSPDQLKFFADIMDRIEFHIEKYYNQD